MPGSPAWIAAWRAGAWPTPPWSTLPMITSSTAAAVDPGAAHRLPDHEGAELRRGERRQAAQEPADGRAAAH